MVAVPWWFLKLSGPVDNGLAGWMDKRLSQLEAVLAERDWLVADRFTVAALLMADVLRVPDVRARGARTASDAYVARVTARTAFGKAHAHQLPNFAAEYEPRPHPGYTTAPHSILWSFHASPLTPTYI